MAPTFISATSSSDGAQITLTYSGSLSTTTAASSAFDVRVDGISVTVSSVNTSGSDVHLELGDSFLAGQSLTVSYTAPANDPTTNNQAIQSASGSDASSVTATAVINLSSITGNTAIAFTQSSLSLGTDNRPEPIASVDLNNDNLIDLVVAYRNASTSPATGGLRVFLGNGAGGFSTGATETIGANALSICANDFNGDNNQDLAITDYEGGWISILLGNGGGGFSSNTTFSPGPAITVGATTITPKPRFLASGDFNGDGKPDLAYTNDYNVSGSGDNDIGKVAIALNNGTGSPFSGGSSSYLDIGTNPYGLIACDLNSDGIIDLAAASSPESGNNGSISVLLGNGNGSFLSAINTSVGTRARYLAAGDFNQDGRQDLALTQSDADNNLRVLLGDGAGSFSSQSTLGFGSVTWPRGVVSGDFNHDGYLDLAAAANLGDNVSLFLGDGSGGFAPRRAFATGDGAIHLVAADFDRDGLPDLAVTNIGGENISVLLNTPADDTPAGVSVQSRDSDADGLLEALSDRNGTVIDGNRDQIADATQSRVSAVRMLNSGSVYSDYGAIELTGQGTLKRTQLIESAADGSITIRSSNQPAITASLPSGISNAMLGAVSFRVIDLSPGASTEVVVHLPQGLSADVNAYLRFNRLRGRFEEYTDTAGNPLYSFKDDNADGVMDRVVLTLVDGDPTWDDDGAADGTVVDPGFVGSGTRSLRGSHQRDSLTGNVLNNTLEGLGGRDNLDGGLGSDLLKGGANRDMLQGGEGADRLIGGSGRDTYRYIDAHDSTLSQQDTVWFKRGDRFDFSALDGNTVLEGRQQLSFIGSTDFSGQAGELRATENGLLADLDGDRQADMAVAFAKPLRSITARHFLL